MKERIEQQQQFKNQQREIKEEKNKAKQKRKYTHTDLLSFELNNIKQMKCDEYKFSLAVVTMAERAANVHGNALKHRLERT